MAERERLLGAVCEAPHDDAPRLVYADWLEENGGEADQPRAEFIRVQLALARMEDGDPARPPLVLRERELMDLHGKAWLAEAPVEMGTTGLRRGFVEEGRMRPEVFQGLGALVWDRVPLVSLILDDTPDDAEGWGESCPQLARLSSLTIHADERSSLMGLDGLIGSPRLAGLRRLDLSPLYQGTPYALPDGMGWPAALEHLEVGSRIMDEAAIAGLRLPRRLASFAVRYAGLNPRRAEALAEALRGLPLRRLDLGYNGLGDDGVAALLAEESLAAGLEEFHLGRNGLGFRAARDIAGCRALANLRWLDLGRSRIGVEGVRLLGQSGHLKRLERLDLRAADESLGDAGVAALLAAPSLAGLRWLNMSGNSTGPAGARAIAGAGREFWHLDLFGNHIGDGGARALAASPHLRRLQSLDLNGNHIRVPGVDALLRSPNMGSLLELDLRGNTVGKAGLVALADSPLSPWANVRMNRTEPSPERDGAVARFGPRLRFG